MRGEVVMVRRHPCHRAMGWVLVFILGVAVACGGESRGGERTPAASAAVDTLGFRQEYGGEVMGNARYFHSSQASGRSTPMALLASVRVVPTDPREPAIIPDLAEIPLEVRLHANPERKGKAVWSSLHASQAGCAERIDQSDPDERGWACRFEVPTILGDSLPATKYYFTTILRFQSDSLKFAESAGFLSPDTLPPLQGIEAISAHLRFGLETTVGVDPGWYDFHLDPSSIVVAATVASVGDRRVRVRYGPCLQVELYTDPERTEPPVWRHDDGCEDLEVNYVVSPGEAVVLRYLGALLRPEWILSDSVPPGRYHVWGEYRISTVRETDRDGRRWEMPEDTTIQVSAGSLLLER